MDPIIVNQPVPSRLMAIKLLIEEGQNQIRRLASSTVSLFSGSGNVDRVISVPANGSVTVTDQIAAFALTTLGTLNVAVTVNGTVNNLTVNKVLVMDSLATQIVVSNPGAEPVQARLNYLNP